MSRLIYKFFLKTVLQLDYSLLKNPEQLASKHLKKPADQDPLFHSLCDLIIIPSQKWVMEKEIRIKHVIIFQHLKD